MALKVIEQASISASDLHEELKRIKKRDEELGFRAQKTVDYLESLNVVNEKKAKEMLEKLMALDVPRLREQHYHKVIDLMPKSDKDVKVALQGYNVTVTQENCKKIADVVAEYA